MRLPISLPLQPCPHQDSVTFVSRVDSVLKVCTQRIFPLKQLRDQGMPLQQLHLLFLILNRITYAIPAWRPLSSI